MLPTLRRATWLLVRYAARVRPGALVLARFADGTLAVKRAVGAAYHPDRRARLVAAERQPGPGRRLAAPRARSPRSDVPRRGAGADLAAAGTAPAGRGRGAASGHGRRRASRADGQNPWSDESATTHRVELIAPTAPAPGKSENWSWLLHSPEPSPTPSTPPARRRPGLRPARRRQDGDPSRRSSLDGPDDLSLAYTPGVARVCEAIAADPSLTQHYTWVPNTVAVVTDGTAVLGLGDIGPAAAMPVMEGKAVLFKQFGGVDAVPICLDTTDVEEIIETVARLAPSFGGINLEDISAPRCFEIEERLKELLDIPVFHDDQHGTAVVALAALQNALRLTGRTPEATRVVISGAGAAGVAVARILLEAGIKDLAVTDRKGVLNSARGDLTPVKRGARRRHRRQLRARRARWPTCWSAPTSSSASPAAPCRRRTSPRWRRTRSSSGWPTRRPRCTPTSPTGTPGWSPPGARTSRTRSTTCWRSPGIFRGAFDVHATAITEGMKLAAADALADLVGDDLRRGPDHPLAVRPAGRPGGRRGRRRGRPARRGRAPLTGAR